MRRSRSLNTRLRRLERNAPEGPPIKEIVVYLPDGKGGLKVEVIPVGLGEIIRRTATPEEARKYYEEHVGLDMDAITRGEEPCQTQ